MRKTRIARTLAALVLGFAALEPSVAPAQTPTLSLGIASVDAAAYPEIRVGVTLPAEMASASPAFVVTENGKAMRIVSADARDALAERAPVRTVLVLDVSGSMSGRALEDAKRAARAFVEGMGPADEMALIAFADVPRVVSRFTSDQPALLSLIESLRASGETAVHDAVVQASALARGGGGATIVLLSDGGDTVSTASLDAAVRTAKAARAPVYAVALRSKEWDPDALQALAKATGGRYLETNDSRELLGIYQSLATELQRAWVITFESGRPAAKDLDIRITATAAGMTAVGSAVVPNPLYAGPPPGHPGVVPGRPDPVLFGATLLATFASAALLALGLAGLFTRRRARLDRLAFYDQTAQVTGRATAAGLQSRLLDAVGEFAGRRGFTHLLAERLQQAGLSLRPAEFIALHLLLVIALGSLAAFASGSVLLGASVAVLATFVPLALLDSAIRKRREAFEEQLPDVLNLIAGSLRAGWGLLQAVGLVVEQAAPPASVEFNRVQTEARLGIPVEAALEKMADRLGSEDFKWTVAAIAVQREVGGNLAEVLDIVAATMRERAQTRRHIKALTAEGRLSATVLIALPFIELVALLVINPGYMSLLVTTPLGWAMSAIAVALLLVGSVWLNRTMSVEV